ncbi:hypothetical protein Zmor_021840 [Zophobas morio]|uniref:Uncharacterized protein n=1 Tax=Zophobas morio TaxID=2755281 RepID=A0AA38I6F5_9CUCU|nr:hypothetical protein Zmor_021840 [Zophobas morio]
MNSSTEVLTKRNGEVVNGSPPNGASASASSKKPKTQQVLIGWDKQKSFTFIGLSLCFVVWACVYFPLIIS